METRTIKRIFAERPNRMPSIRAVRGVAIYIAGNGGISKREALTQVGFSESVADSPARVFESKAVLRYLKERGIDESLGIDAVKRNIVARQPGTMSFPLYKEKGEDEEDEVLLTEDEIGQLMTNNDIRDFLTKNSCEVYRIITNKHARIAYFYTNDSKAQLTAADMLFNLIGSYAPKKTEGKFDHRVGVFSMSELRKTLKAKKKNNGQQTGGEHSGTAQV